MMVINTKLYMDMKKLKHSLLFGVLTLFVTSCMEVDNFDEPDAHFTGRIIDKTTGRISRPIRCRTGEDLGEKASVLIPFSNDSCEAGWHFQQYETV